MTCAILIVCLLDFSIPPVEEMPLSITSYWLFNDSGVSVPWGGQADGDPTVYANMMPTDPAHAEQVGACIGDWVTLGYTTAVSFTWQGKPLTIACWDAFGLESYRKPFFHGGYGEWVIPVDILSPLPYHGLVWEWQREMVPVR